MAEYNKFTVKQLKEKLKSKGISSSKTRKRDLIDVLEKVGCLYDDLEPCDYHESQRKRRIVRSSKGEVVDLNGLQCSWTKNLGSMPLITSLDVYAYLISTCDWSQTKLKAYREQDGYKMYLDRHVESVEVGSIQDCTDFIYIQGKVKPEQRQSAERYDTWILVSSSCEIQSAGCQCVAADDGTCKHVVCLLFAVTDFNDRRVDRGTQVGTDKICTWNVPRKESHPMRVEELNFCHDKSIPLRPVATPLYFQPLHDLQPSAVFDLKVGLQKLCREIKPGALYLTATDTPPIPTTDMPPNIYDLVKQHAYDENSENVIDFLRNKVSASDRDFVSHLSQADPRWLESRRGRLTASQAASIFSHRPTSKGKTLISNVVHQEYKDNANFQHGRKYEPVARQRYMDEVGPMHKSFCVTETGLHINESMPFLGASPDGLVSCKCHRDKLLEIKCSSKHYTEKVERIPDIDSRYHLVRVNNELSLKETSPWYKQIQFQMGVCGVYEAELVVHTRHGIAIIPVPWNPEIWQKMSEKAVRVFQDLIVPAIVKSQK